MALASGEAVFLCCAIAGDIFGVDDVCAVGDELGVGVGDPFGAGLGFGVGVGFATLSRLRLFALGVVDEPRLVRPADEFAFLAGCGLRFQRGGVGPAS